MQLTPELIDAWVALTCAPGGDPATHARGVRQRAENSDYRALRFITPDGGGATWLVPVGTGRWLVGSPRTRDDIPVGEAVAALVGEAVAEVRRRQAVHLESRIPVDRESEALVTDLADAGLIRASERVEYKTPMAELPDEGPSPLTWIPSTGDDLDRFAALLLRVSAGPDGLESDEDPLEWLQDVLSDEARICDPARVLHRGVLDDKDVAFVCGQTEPQGAHAGWSTLPFLGVRPEARGRGLGRVAHRHGIAMLRAQGATLYHGGTDAENAPMRACFEANGCREWQRFGVWQHPAL